MFKKLAAVFYRSIKTWVVAECFYSDKTCAVSFLNGFKKSVSVGSLNKGSNCEGKILAYKKNKLCLISIICIKNTNEECFIRI